MADHHTDGYEAAKQDAREARAKMHKAGGGRAVAARYAEAIEETFHGWFAGEAKRGTVAPDLVLGMAWAIGHNLASVALGLGHAEREPTIAAANFIADAISSAFSSAVDKHFSGRAIFAHQSVEEGGFVDLAVGLPGRGRSQ
jgi:hypothetical protein